MVDGFDLSVGLLPFGIEVVEDGVDDAITASGVLEVSHHLQPPSDFPETAFDNVGGANHLANFLWELKDRNQPVKVILQTVDRFGDLVLPFFFPGPEPLGGGSRGFSIHDPSGLADTFVAVSLGTVPGHIAQLVHPAELMFNQGVNLLDSRP